MGRDRFCRIICIHTYIYVYRGQSSKGGRGRFGKYIKKVCIFGIMIRGSNCLKTFFWGGGEGRMVMGALRDKAD